MKFDAYIFDLDGTLLDTLQDLVRLTNMVLRENGWPERTRDEILSFVGFGGRHLIGRAAPEGTPGEVLDDVFARWQELYPEYGHALTKPYDGVPETLAQLKDGGAKLGVLSNKFDAAVKSVIEEHFPGVFDLARGECEEIPRKPDPTGLRFMMNELGVRPGRVAYVGDSPGDIHTAKSAGTLAVGVSWGYRTVGDLQDASADSIIYNPGQLLDL